MALKFICHFFLSCRRLHRLLVRLHVCSNTQIRMLCRRELIVVGVFITVLFVVYSIDGVRNRSSGHIRVGAVKWRVLKNMSRQIEFCTRKSRWNKSTPTCTQIIVCRWQKHLNYLLFGDSVHLTMRTTTTYNDDVIGGSRTHHNLYLHNSTRQLHWMWKRVWQDPI